MRPTGSSLVAVAAVVLAISLPAIAESRTVGSVVDLRNALNQAQAGDRISVLPGHYTTRLWAQDVNGAPGSLIEVVAADPTDRPVFDVQDDSCITFWNCSYILVDGIIVQGAGTPTSSGNNIDITYSDHMILKNSVSRDMTHTGNSDGTKFNHSENVLMYNCTISEWGEAGSGMDGMISNSDLFMRNTFTFASLATAASANGIMPKGAAYHHGIYKNLFIDGSSRAVCFGGSGGAVGPEIYDSVAMGNVIVGGEAALAYVSSTNCEFSYNTVVDPEKWVMRVQKEGVYETDYNTFKRNLVHYGPFLPGGSVQGTGGTVHPETFTYQANYWYKSDNPAASIPSLPGGESDPAGGVDPQLDSDNRPHYAAAKQYGAFAPQMESEFEQYTGWFQWAWDRAQQFEPKADAGGVYHIGPGQTIALDASGSRAGSGPYDNDPAHPEWHQAITDYLWDLDWDSEFDDAGGETPQVSYDDLVALGLSPGWHTIELEVLVSTPYGQMDDWGFAQIHMVDPLLPGDADYDGDVDLSDMITVARNWGKDPAKWEDGNFNPGVDTVVGILDLEILARNWTGVGEAAGAVPEPAGMLLLALGGVGLIRRRRH